MRISESQLVNLIKECYQEVVQEIGGYGISDHMNKGEEDIQEVDGYGVSNQIDNVQSDVTEGANNDPNYNYYIVNKKTRKIVFGYDYNGVEKADRDYYTSLDMEDNGWDSKTYGLFSKPYLLKNGINPDDNASWDNN